MRHRFSLQISIRPKNDIPIIELRRGALLRLAKGTKKLLPSNIFDVKDPDDDAADIAITLVSPVTGEETLSYGHIENERFPGQRQTRFSLEDLKKDNVYYVMDEAGGVTQLGLRVSDRREVGNTVVLPVETFQLQARLPLLPTLKAQIPPSLRSRSYFENLPVEEIETPDLWMKGKCQAELFVLKSLVLFV